jgi:hypothetical protein
MRAFVMVLGAALSACGGAGHADVATVDVPASPSANATASASISPKVEPLHAGVGDAPIDWTGTWFSESLGSISLIEREGKIAGKWMRPDKSAWGELHGVVTGDHCEFSFAEYVVGTVGPGSSTKGSGHFDYVAGGAHAATLKGEVTVDGGKATVFSAVKQVNAAATPAIQGDWD